jgi:general secretion pathway protein G
MLNKGMEPSSNKLRANLRPEDWFLAKTPRTTRILSRQDGRNTKPIGHFFFAPFASLRDNSVSSRPRRRGQRGLTLVELVVAFTIMLILSSMAVPLARSKVRVQRERELRADLEDMRHAIDKYKDMCDAAYLGQVKVGTDCFPENLEILVEGVKLPGPDGKKLKLLRRIPIDPFTHTAEWGLRSDQDDPKSFSWGGQNVFDVYSKTTEKDSSGHPYSEY